MAAIVALLGLATPATGFVLVSSATGLHVRPLRSSDVRMCRGRLRLGRDACPRPESQRMLKTHVLVWQIFAASRLLLDVFTERDDVPVPCSAPSLLCTEL